MVGCPDMVEHIAGSIVAGLCLEFSAVVDTAGDILQVGLGVVAVLQEILKSLGTAGPQCLPKNLEVLQASLLVACQHLEVADAPGGEVVHS